jgi:hypothetical protein
MIETSATMYAARLSGGPVDLNGPSTRILSVSFRSPKSLNIGQPWRRIARSGHSRSGH